jgi:transposase
MAVADRHGLPIAVGIASGQRHETKLVIETLRQRFLKKLPLRLIGDRAYDSDGLDAELRTMGVELIAPHNPRRKNLTQDGRPLRRYKRRWHVERLFAWLQCSRRLITRFETKAEKLSRLYQASLRRTSLEEVVKCVLVRRTSIAILRRAE